MKDLDDIKGGRGDRRPSMGDLATVYKFPKQKYVGVRLLPGLVAEAGYWVKTKTKTGKHTKFYTPCPSFDIETQERDSTIKDPWRDLQQREQRMIDAGTLDKDDARIQYAVNFWMQAIIRSEQKKKPSRLPKPTAEERKTGFKDKESDTWSPVMVIKVGRGLAGKFKELKGLNTVESKQTGAVKAFAINDVKFGRDVRIYFDDDKAPAQMYDAQLGEKRTPLTEEEQEYLTYDLNKIAVTKFDPKEVMRDFESWANRNGVKMGKKTQESEESDDDDDQEDEDFDTPKKSNKSKKAPPKKKSRDEDFDDEDDSDHDDDFDDEDEDEKPSKKKAPAKKGKKPVDEDEDDFDDEDNDFDDDEEEDDKPSKKKATAKKAVKNKPADEDDFDDEDEDEDRGGNSDDDFDDFDDEDEEDEKPAKKKAPAKKVTKKKPVDEDEDDFDDDDDSDSDDDFDDDEDEKPSKKKAPAKKAAPKKGKKPVDEDDDDFDDDSDEDEDEDDFDDEEEEEKPKRKPAAKKAPAKKSTKKPVDDDLDDDEDF